MRYPFFKSVPKLFLWLAIGSILLNIVFFGIDMGPDVVQKLKGTEYLENTDDREVEKLLVNASYKMFASRKLHMPWTRPRNFIEKVKALNLDEETRIFNFPRAYLALGLITYSANNDTILLKKVIDQFDAYYVSEDGPKFDFTIVDQAPLGYAALELFKFTKKDKYKKMADQVFAKLKTMVVTDYGFPIFLYRSHQNDLLVDTLGMICPFLMEYGNYFGNEEALELARSQLDFFREYGLDHDNHLPFHAISLAEKEALGPNNWGRGMGWYMLALKSVAQYSDTISEKRYGFKEEADMFIKSMNLLKEGEMYTQFPGTSGDFDSSASTMLLYGENVLRPNTYSKREILSVFKKYIKTDGILDKCSGDAFGVNKYSLVFGESELSQGMLLLLLNSATD